MILHLSLNLPEDSTFIRTTRLLSRCLLQDMKVVEGDIDDVETIVAELCSNVICHSRSKATHFRLDLEYYKPKVVIIVVDEGQGFVQEDVPGVGTWRSDGLGTERLGGYGLSLLAGLSDKLDFTTTEPQGTTVRVEKNLRYETQEKEDEAAERDAAGRGGEVTIEQG